MEYQPPYTYKEIIHNYGRQTARRLAADSVHRWRMDTGIQLIHKEPTLDKQFRIYRNWLKMTPEMKRWSDLKSLELFGMRNMEHHAQIIWDEWPEADSGMTLDQRRHSRFMREYLEKQQALEERRIAGRSKGVYGEFAELNMPIVHDQSQPFRDFLDGLLCEDYEVFPVPEQVLDLIQDFVQAGPGVKNIPCREFLELAVDWAYYIEFKTRLEKLADFGQAEPTLICLSFDSLKQVQAFVQKHPCGNSAQQIYESFATMYLVELPDGSAQFCLCVDREKNPKRVRKAIMHELVHFLQYTLNAPRLSPDDSPSHGLFSNIRCSLSPAQLSRLSLITGSSRDRLAKNFKYCMSARQFQAWVCNACFEFRQSGLALDEFLKKAEDSDEFEKTYLSLRQTNEWDLAQALLFCRFCRLASENNPDDDRWYYLVNALQLEIT